MINTRTVGRIYLISAVVGLIFGVVGLIVLWGTRASVVRSITGSVALVGRSLSATETTMDVLDTSIQQANADLDIAQKMLADMSDTMDGSRGMIDRTADLVGGQLVVFVNNTRTSLDSVQTSANVVDNMLRTITGIPLIGPWLGGQKYNPPVPLGDSVANVRKSMDPLPITLSGIQRDLKTSSGNVATIKDQVDALSKQVDSIRASITDARKVISEYRDVLREVQTRYQKLEKGLPLAINLVYILLTLLLLWMILSQVGVLMHGLTLLANPSD